MGWTKLLDFGFEHIDIWRSEPMSLAQVGRSLAIIHHTAPQSQSELVLVCGIACAGWIDWRHNINNTFSPPPTRS